MNGLFRVLIAVSLVAATAGAALAQESFYKGKNIRLLVAYPPGGGFDTYARLAARHWGRHIPGQPRFIVQNMPGAGGVVALNHLYNGAKPDGLTMGFSTGGNFAPFTAKRTGIEFRAPRFLYVGNFVQDVAVCFARHDAPFKRVEDVIDSKETFFVGGTGPGSPSDDIPKVVNEVLRTRIKVVAGYGGTAPMHMAIERGEIQGRCGFMYSGLKAASPHWIEKKFINIFLQMGMHKHPELAQVRWIFDLPLSADDKATLEVLFSQFGFARPLVLPPGTPPERVQILRRSFMALMKDPEFQKEADRAGMELSPVSGEEIQKLVDRVYAYPEAVINRVAKLLE
jgi:tripartite-type tricarboxylate transporter receptor subunit TctC